MYKESIAKIMNSLLKMSSGEEARFQPRRSYVENVSRRRTARKSVHESLDATKPKGSSTIWNDLFTFGGGKNEL